MKSKVEIKKMIINDPMETLVYLEELIRSNKHVKIHNLIFTLKSELYTLEKQNMSGALPFDEFSRLQSRINLNILNIIEQIPDNLFARGKSDQSQSSKPAVKINNPTAFIEVLSLIRKLSEVRIKELELQNIPNPEGLFSQLNTNRHIILNQIIKLVELHDYTLSSVEYRVIAEGFQAVFDNIKAAEYYRKAIDTIDEYTDSTNSQIVAIRCYAAFLYSVNRSYEGSMQFEAALLNNTNDEANIFNGYTRQMQFITECNMGDFNKAFHALTEAKKYYSAIINPMFKQQNLSNLEQAWNMSPLVGKYVYPE